MNRSGETLGRVVARVVTRVLGRVGARDVGRAVECVPLARGDLPWIVGGLRTGRWGRCGRWG